MNAFLHQYFAVFFAHHWVFKIFIVVLCTLIIDYVLHRIYKKFSPKLEKRTKIYWHYALFKALQKPLRYFIWVFGVALAAILVADHTDVTIVNKAIEPIRNLFIIILLVWFLVQFIANVEKNIIKRHAGIDKTTVHGLSQIARVAVVITAVIIAMQVFGLPISGIIAFGGVGGLAVGFAAKDLLANFFGSIVVFLDRPFKVGDWIKSPDREIEGTVEYIGWRSTRIRTFEQRALYVPNSAFLTISVENPSRMLNRRIKASIGVRYADAKVLPQIVAEVKQMLLEDPEIDHEQNLLVNFNEFGSSSLNFMVYAFTKTTQWKKYLEIQQAVYFKIMDIIIKHGAECAFPTTTLDIPDPFNIHQTQEK